MKDENHVSAGKRAAVSKPSESESVSSADLPVFCTLTPETLAIRKAALLPGLVDRALSREETANGVRLTLPADALQAVLDTVDAERKCCRFLRFEITVEPDGGPISLELAGPPGTREFLAALSKS